MFTQNCTFHDGQQGLTVDGLHIFKFMPYFEEKVRNAALDQRLPLEVLRVLKPCRGAL